LLAIQFGGYCYSYSKTITGPPKEKKDRFCAFLRSFVILEDENGVNQSFLPIKTQTGNKVGE